jgi:hypothetical protein
LNKDRFRAFYGIHVEAVSALFESMKSANPNKSISSKDLFMTLNWLKSYDTEHVLAGRWGLSEEIIRNKVRQVATKIAELSKLKFTGEGDRMHGEGHRRQEGEAEVLLWSKGEETLLMEEKVWAAFTATQ